MKAILELDMPDSCLICKISDYESGDEEKLFCPVLEKEGLFNSRLPECPLLELRVKDQ